MAQDDNCSILEQRATLSHCRYRSQRSVNHLHQLPHTCGLARDWQMSSHMTDHMATTHDYLRDGSIYLNVTERENVSLRLALREALAAAGVTMQHTTPTGGSYAPGSHVDTMVKLYARLDRAYHGSKLWNGGDGPARGEWSDPRPTR